MTFSLIICTYMRSEALRTLLQSVEKQTKYPNEILIIDGSHNRLTDNMLRESSFKNLIYYLVPDEHRGLTRQRNYGITKAADHQVICFLDDDTVLEPDYFEQLLHTYEKYPDALGVGGYITNEDPWYRGLAKNKSYFNFDGWYRKEGSRWLLRKKLQLDSNSPPGYMPAWSHGRSISFLPPSGNTYAVEHFMGGVSSFRKSVFKNFAFSHYFEGYGLYEDADFCLRVSKTGSLYVNTAARLAHYHDDSGRPNYYKYGIMVVRNGWYVWRVKYAQPSISARTKWHAITLLLIFLRYINVLFGPKRNAAFREALGRSVGWFTLFFRKPR